MDGHRRTAGKANTGTASAAATPEQNAEQKRYSDRVQGRLSRPAGQAIERRPRFPACFDSVGDGPRGFPDRLGGRPNSLSGLVELAWTVGLRRLMFAGHLNSPVGTQERRPRAKIVPHLRDRPVDRVARSVQVTRPQVRSLPPVGASQMHQISQIGEAR